MEKRFETDEFVKVAKRENNLKRPYLYVNPLQGKHIPVSPSASLELFGKLAKMLEARYAGETLLVIGFAETATAIGAAIACEALNVKYYMSTTREDLPDAEYLFFSESHSHASEQRLVTNKLEKCLADIDRIIFAEDEVTTGNTIEKLIGQLQRRYPGKAAKFGVVSILNSMEKERIDQLKNRGIACDYLHLIPAGYGIDKIGEYVDQYVDEETDSHVINPSENLPETIGIGGYWNSRIVSSTENIRNKCSNFVIEAKKFLRGVEDASRILILGTEEFMFPAMLLGSQIEREYPTIHVKFHATTRSPIQVSADVKYPLHSRFSLDSFYEKGRRTFIYNLEKYDQVCVITDGVNFNENEAGILSLARALECNGNKNILLIKWEDEQ